VLVFLPRDKRGLPVVMLSLGVAARALIAFGVRLVG
jgi:hypothetical protein